MRNIIVKKLDVTINCEDAYAVEEKSQNGNHTYNCDCPLPQFEDAYYVYNTEKKANQAREIIITMRNLGLSYSEIALECARFNMLSK